MEEQPDPAGVLALQAQHEFYSKPMALYRVILAFVHPSLLPAGWMFKKICEGFDQHKSWYANYHYLSREGEVLDSMRKVITHMKSTPGYDEKDEENCKEFIQDQKPASIKHEWNEGDDTLPKGWKMRVSEGKLYIFSFSFILYK